MKIFHLSDLHIGLKLINRDLYEDQKYIFDQITEQVKKEKPDAIVIAGDIYDKSVPSAEAVELFDYFVSRLSAAAPESVIMMISGNHDSAPRVNCFRSVLKQQQIYMVGMPPQRPGEQIEKVTLTDAFGPVNLYLLPFVKPSMVKAIVGSDENGNNLSYAESIRRLLACETIDETERNVIVSHQFYLRSGTSADSVDRMESEIRTAGNIDEVSADVLKAFDYAALGHIHKPMKVGSETIRYCGTPLACSVSEAEQEKGIVMVELEEKGVVKTTVIPLVPLRKVRVLTGSLEEVLLQACADYVTVVLTDKVDLDVLDMQDRLHNAFPYLLEIRRELNYRNHEMTDASLEEMPEPYDLCMAFLNDVDDEEKDLLRDILNKVQGVE